MLQRIRTIHVSDAVIERLGNRNSHEMNPRNSVRNQLQKLKSPTICELALYLFVSNKVRRNIKLVLTVTFVSERTFTTGGCLPLLEQRKAEPSHTLAARRKDPNSYHMGQRSLHPRKPSFPHHSYNHFEGICSREAGRGSAERHCLCNDCW